MNVLQQLPELNSVLEAEIGYVTKLVDDMRTGRLTWDLRMAEP